MAFNMNPKEEFHPKLIRKGYVINGFYIKAANVYGLKTSSLSKEKEKCLICFDNYKDTIIQPCQHLCICE